MNVPLGEESQGVVDADCIESGMPKVEFLRRLLTWYAAQNDVVRGTIRGTIPPSVAPDVARMILDRMANGESLPSYQKLVGSIGGPKKPKAS